MIGPRPSRHDGPQETTYAVLDVDPVERASSDSFPASDPPSRTGAQAGSPPHVSTPAGGGPAVRVEPESAAPGHDRTTQQKTPLA